MRRLLIMLVVLVLVSTALQGAILVWFYGMSKILFWTSVGLLVATTAILVYFVLKAGVKESLKYLWDYWFLTLSK